MMTLIGCLLSLAKEFEVNGIYYLYHDESAKTVAVTCKGDYWHGGLGSYSGSVTIPSFVRYNGVTYSVTSISAFAFTGSSGLTEVTIPNSVTEIGYWAFAGCHGLKEVTIPNSVTEINELAFANCRSLTKVNYNAVNCTFHYDGWNYIFNECDNLKTLIIGDEVKTIPHEAFKGCDGLKEVLISNSVTKIGAGAFEYCGSLTKLTIPNSVIEIGESAFENCDSLTKLTIPNSVIEIGNGAFAGCDGLKEVIIPNSVTKIGERAFSNCKGLKEVTIPNSVTEIGGDVFAGCSALTKVNYNAEHCVRSNPIFRGCEELKTFNIGNEVRTIPNYIFSNCKGLKEVIIPNSVTKIGEGAFSDCKGLKEVTIPNSVTEIGAGAFNDCKGLTDVNISDLSAWCKISFENAYANPMRYSKKINLNGYEIKELIIPNDITQIKFATFYGNEGLTSVTIPNSVTDIGKSAFYGCKGLTKVIIPDSVIEIGKYAFAGCESLTVVTMGKSVQTIGENAFYEANLEKIIFLNPIPPVLKNIELLYDYNDYRYNKNRMLCVSADGYSKYFTNDVFGKFNNIKKIETLVSSIKLKKKIKLDKGSKTTLSAKISPAKAIVNDVFWSSDNPHVATIDQSGTVTALNPGMANITAMSLDGSNISASCNVIVNSVKITLSKTKAYLPVNETMILTYDSTASNTSVEWSTSNPNIAMIKKYYGSIIVVGMDEGEVIITATSTDDPGVSASCKVIVGKD